MTGAEPLGAPLHYPSALPPAERVLLVMLPGAGIDAADFAAHGLVAAAQRGMPALDVIALRPNLDLYLEGNLAPVLHEGVIAPALASGIRRIWLLGVSLGGMGALLYASEYPGLVEGLVLLAPFLGTHGTIAGLTQAGSFDLWEADGSGATAPERQLLSWLQGHLRTGARFPRIFLGHGERDRFAAGHRLVAAELPESQVVRVGGGHDWAAWTEAWAAILARKPFG
jgi:pimeloyl-ACP methyl ester carboxylesterase